jgi:hypothetical protein
MIQPDIFNLGEVNFEFTGVTVNYNNSYSCKESGCDEEGICRCGVIENEIVTNVNSQRVFSHIYGLTFGDMTKERIRDVRISELLGLPGIEILNYTIDRICRIHKLWSPDKWNIEISGGYYGQEIVGIYLLPDVTKQIIDDIIRITQIQNVEDIIEALLLLEYGSVHQDLQNCVYEQKIVDLKSIKFGAIQHLKSVRKKNNTHYSDDMYKGIRGIVVPNGDGYKAIDGYHRMNSTKLEKVKVLVARKIV